MSHYTQEPLVVDQAGILEQEVLHRWQPTSIADAKDNDESARVGRVIRAVSKQCWFNARRAIFKLEDYAGASYVEGWAVLNSMPMEHGWLVNHGKIVDPTLPGHEGVYFPGLEFHGRDGIDEFLKTSSGKKRKNSPFFYAFGWGGMYCPSFRNCYDDAMTAFKALIPR